MRYLIKQKLFSLSDGFTIKNENNEDCFKVKGKIISVGKKLRLLDMNDTELVYIQEKVLSFFASYELKVNSETVMKVKGKFSPLRCKFAITGQAGEYDIEGNILAREFKILKNGNVVVTVSKKFLALTDTYTVDISEGEDVALMLSVAIVLDMSTHRN